jgi:hypothetical protein
MLFLTQALSSLRQEIANDFALGDVKSVALHSSGPWDLYRLQMMSDWWLLHWSFMNFCYLAYWGL